jgi:hypothetical protein
MTAAVEDTVVQIQDGEGRWTDYARTTRAAALAAVAAGTLPGHPDPEPLRAVDWITKEDVMTTTLEAPEAQPEVARITQVEDLPDPVRADIVSRREAGETLAELKTRFAHVDPAVIRDVLPPANARERKAREAKEAKSKVTESKQGVGGRSGEAKSEPKAPKADQPKEPKPAPEPKYASAEDLGDLPERVDAARQVMGRNELAKALGITGSACWRHERGRTHPGEVAHLREELPKIEERIAAGEFIKQEKSPATKQPSKADLTHRVEVVTESLRSARSDKSITKAALIDSALAVLAPTDAPKA